MSTLTADPAQVAGVDQVIQEGIRLQGRLSELGGALRQVAAQLEGGTPPSTGIAASIIEISKAFETWHAHAQNALGGRAVEPILPRVMEALEGHKRQLEEAALRQKAMAVLEQVSSLAYRGNEEFMPLSTVQFDALGLMRSMKDATGLDDTSRALVAGTHPLNALLRLLTDKEMSNDEWQALYQNVGQTFGTDLSVAIARGFVYLPEA
ncbi:MAG: hypothetical protein C4331_01635 [Meiothermus sp.]